MTNPSISIYFPDGSSLQSTLDKLNAYKRAREAVSKAVLGHAVSDADWILFDDMLTMDYNRMKLLLQKLEERAG